MTDINMLEEINDEMRREKLVRFWRENGPWIIGSAIAAILLTAALSFWQQWEHKRNLAATTELHRLALSGNLPGLESFADGSDKKHAVLARLIAAGQHANRGERDKALALYAKIAGTSGIDKTWRQLAQLLSISQRLDQDDPAQLEKELAPLIDDAAPWRYTARELAALLAARQNQWQKAIDILGRITADPQAPAEARTRALTLGGLYAANIAGDTGKKADSKT